jgi:hypothetical protein
MSTATYMSPLFTCDGIEFDASDNMYIADKSTHVVYKVTGALRMQLWAGTPQTPSPDATIGAQIGDGACGLWQLSPGKPPCSA